MTQLDAIRIRLEHIRQGHVPPLSGSLLEWYCQDIALLLQLADGVQAAEQHKELVLLRELRADVERWREGGGDGIDVGYIPDTLDKLEQRPGEEAPEEY